MHYLLYHEIHRNPKKTKEDVVAHFQKRCMERLGFIIRQRDLKTAMDNLNSGLVVFSKRQSNSKSHFRLSGRFLESYGYKNDSVDVVAVYDRIRHNFVTVLLYGKDGTPMIEED